MQTGLAVETLSGFPRSGNALMFPNSAPVVQAAFAEEIVDSGRNSSLVEISDEHVLVLRVTDHQPSSVQPLEAVRDQIEQELTRSRAQELADAAATAFLADLAADGDAAALAAMHQGTWYPSAAVERTSAEVPTEVLAAAFALPKPAAGEIVRENVGLANGDQAVLVLSGVAPGEPEGIPPDDREQRRRQLADQAAAAELTSYAGDLRERATVRIPDEILNPTTF
jgi:peptidyl-prolyl cis-trans isomerase D